MPETKTKDGYFVKTDTKDDDSPEVVVAVPGSLYEKNLREGAPGFKGYEELTHKEFVALQKRTGADDESIKAEFGGPGRPVETGVNAADPAVAKKAEDAVKSSQGRGRR